MYKQFTENSIGDYSRRVRRQHRQVRAPAQPSLSRAKVLAAHEMSGWLCESVQGTVVASTADSLILQPTPGDIVLLAFDGGQPWLLAVLQREQPQAPAVLSVPTAATLVLSSPALALQAQQLTLAAEDTRASLGAVSLATRCVSVVSQRIHLWAQLIQTQAQTLVTRASRRVTHVQGSDVLQAQELVMSGKRLARLDGAQVQIEAEKHMLLDAKRIVVG